MLPIQRSLGLEADRGFQNLQGRQQRFHAFLQQQLAAPPALPFPQEVSERMSKLSSGFADYPNLADPARRRLVTDARQWLHELRHRLEPSAPMAPPRLKVQASPQQRTSSPLQLDSPITQIRGVGPKFAARLASIGLLLVRDLLRYYPRDHVDYSAMRRIEALVSGETATIVATIRRCNGFVSPRNTNLAIIELQLQDPTGRLKVSRFLAGKRFSSPAYLKGQQRLYPVGATVAVSGLVKDGPYGITFQDPLIEVLDSPSSPVKSPSIGRLLPVYPLTEGVGADRFRSLIDQVLPLAASWPDPLPALLQRQFQLPALSDSLQALHAPKDRESLDQGRRRLVFDEFLLMQLGLLRRRQALRSRTGPDLDLQSSSSGLVGEFMDLLPFRFTAAQQRVFQEIEVDLARSEPMARLVQGDVGSGKTVVAIAALLSTIASGWQGALMAPTEVLAEQHYRNLCQWLPQLHVSVALLTGSTPRPRRRELLDDLANGSLKVLVGTHALLEDPVVFNRLGLVVVDEQHRFGVHQRDRLLNKGLQPHLLTMTATPIPRTLALSMHGDLDVSQIDELPPGRTPIRTRMLTAAKREKAYELIREEVQLGQRAYVVLPLVDESEKLELRSAVEVHAELASEVFPDLAVGLLHGRLSSADKQAVLTDFSAGKTQVLVSTTVVEVGVDVPEASVMVIDHAERFGLAQLHQLRGRVGRGAAASHCLLINGSSNPLARQRLDVLVRSTDGFEIAEMDLRLRGPGQVLGTRQSGLPDLALASLADDGAVLEDARTAAQELLKTDPELEQHPLLRETLDAQQRRLSGGTPLN
ncbi:ATP-dependent DNA helicase RecG [Synechococcus sp. CC9605]|uniref:ATP-dependent DNA helicase RecG n=1 Tax=Synechococcus sp. (strain CC9605) TaxID=110662 RepID=UPI00005D5A01|nr:ATP-dependent DNA helicase RecG [Synechococcus sp. CC9605]ABB34980.1 ATP-dependent DNA helicase RecG [Synechococcus sp. CC9605]